MNGVNQIWADPRLVYTVAVAAVALLAVTIWLFRRKKKTGRGAGMICLVLSIVLHVALIFLVPLIANPNGGSASVDPDKDVGGDDITFSMFDPDLHTEEVSGTDPSAVLKPLPVAELTDLLADEAAETTEQKENAGESDPATPDTPESIVAKVPESLQITPSTVATETAATDTSATDTTATDTSATDTTATDTAPDQIAQDIGDALDDLLLAQVESEAAQSMAAVSPPALATPQEPPSQERVVVDPPESNGASENIQRAKQAAAPKSLVPKSLEADFANRSGAAKQEALYQTGGNLETEAAVALALRFLADAQRDDGAWDPRSTGAGVERKPLGEFRGGAGTKAESGLTGLALLTLMGSGQTHRKGQYADNVFRGLAHLIGKQKPDGSLAGDATVYSASYCHSMAALAMCEAAAVTGDPSAVESARRAIAHSVRMQHPVTGGWRYTAGDPGDLSQLGWQAMVFDAAVRARIPISRNNVSGVERFLRSVRAGRGGLASYRPGEKASRTMTAEALATRLLIGQSVPQREIDEASRYILQEKPGRGVDNYYYWYYATLALHQLQDDSWEQWNTALQSRLLSTQRSNGSWPTTSLWGGYGGTVYTTSMATLCLESYYRHAIRKNENRITRLQVAPVNR